MGESLKPANTGQRASGAFNNGDPFPGLEAPFCLEQPEAEETRRSAPRVPPRIVEEFDDWLVVEKPAQMQVHPSKPADRRTLWHHLCDLLSYERVNGMGVSIINRLDRETSGLTLVAKTRGAARSLCRQMEAHHIQKYYHAIVFGWPDRKTWEVDAPILRQGTQAPSRIWLKQCIHPQGSPAFTQFECLLRMRCKTEPANKFSLIRAIPKTGRMHQIRVHLAASGCPLVGDKIYGADEGCYLEFIKTGWTASLERRLLLDRHALHASSLRLLESNQHWEIPMPADLLTFLEGLTALDSDKVGENQTLAPERFSPPLADFGSRQKPY